MSKLTLKKIIYRCLLKMNKKLLAIFVVEPDRGVKRKRTQEDEDEDEKDD